MLGLKAPSRCNWKPKIASTLVAAVLFYLSVATLLAPQATFAADSYLEAGVTADSLTNGYADWRGYYLNGSHKFAPRQSVYAGLLHAQRYDLIDDQLTVGAYQPLAERTALLAEGTLSNTHNFLPNWSTLAQLEHQLNDGWDVAFGWLHRVYTDTQGDTVKFTGERYWSNFRAAYTLSVGRSAILGSTVGHHLNGDYYYNDTSYLGLGLAAGEELDNVASTTLHSKVRTIYLRGLHLFAESWGITYQLSVHKQGDYYTRKGISLGLRYLF